MPNFTPKQLNPEELKQKEQQLQEVFGDIQAEDQAFDQMHDFFRDKFPEVDYTYYHSYFRWYTELSWDSLRDRNKKFVTEIAVPRQIVMAAALDYNIAHRILMYIGNRSLDDKDAQSLFHNIKRGFLDSGAILAYNKQGDPVTLSKVVDKLQAIEKKGSSLEDAEFYLNLRDQVQNAENNWFEYITLDLRDVIELLERCLRFLDNVKAEDIFFISQNYLQPDLYKKMNKMVKNAPEDLSEVVEEGPGAKTKSEGEDFVYTAKETQEEQSTESQDKSEQINKDTMSDQSKDQTSTEEKQEKKDSSGESVGEVLEEKTSREEPQQQAAVKEKQEETEKVKQQPEEVQQKEQEDLQSKEHQEEPDESQQRQDIQEKNQPNKQQASKDEAGEQKEDQQEEEQQKQQTDTESEEAAQQPSEQEEEADSESKTVADVLGEEPSGSEDEEEAGPTQVPKRDEQKQEDQQQPEEKETEKKEKKQEDEQQPDDEKAKENVKKHQGKSLDEIKNEVEEQFGPLEEIDVENIDSFKRVLKNVAKQTDHEGEADDWFYFDESSGEFKWSEEYFD